MPLPAEPVTFSAQQIADLNRKLSEMRHTVNNNLAMLVAAIELIRRKPESAVKFADSMASQTEKMTEEIQIFSIEFEKAFGITRGNSNQIPE